MNTQTKTVYPIFFSFEKEEVWLEEMSTQGWLLVRAPGFGYTFEKAEPQKRAFKIDYRYFKNQADMEDYLSLFEDSGWQYVKPNKHQYSYYFYSSSEDAPQDIFSDVPSRAQRSLRAAQYSTYTMFLVMLPYLALYLSGTIRLDEIGYLTPGLWQMQGLEFIRHFLFETPFVVMRVVTGLFPLFVLLAMLIFYLQAYRSYKQKVKHL